VRVDDAIVDPARAGGRTRPASPRGEPAGRAAGVIAHGGRGGHVVRQCGEEIQPGPAHAVGAPQSLRIARAVARMSARSSSSVGRPQNQYPSYARWIFRSGNSVKTTGAYGSWTVSVVSRSPSRACTARSGSARNVQRAPIPARNAAATSGASTLT